MTRYQSTIEDPCGPNPFLLRLDEQTGSLAHASSPGVWLSRKRFAWDKGSSPSLIEATAAFESAVAECVAEASGQAYWIAAWRDHDPTPARSRLTTARRASEGWEIEKFDGLSIAGVEWEGAGLAPENFEWGDGGCIVVVVPAANSWSVLCEPAAQPTLLDLASARELRPSNEFIAVVSKHRLCCLYSQRDDLGRLELIVLQPSRKAPA